MRATKAIIHLKNIAHNIECVQNHIKNFGKKSAICLPVKADAYGHGALALAKFALQNGVSYLAAATVDEGVELRSAGITCPILIFSQMLAQEMEAAVFNKLIPLIGDKESAALFSDYGRVTTSTAGGSERHRNEAAQRRSEEAGARGAVPPAKVFLKVDTGMSRMGCKPEEAAELARYIASLGNLKQAGTITHFAAADGNTPSDMAFTQLQLQRFNFSVNAVRAAGIDAGIISAANTGGTIACCKAWFDLVRPGILLYGYTPCDLLPKLPVKPVMELVTQVVCVKQIEKGSTVSYGRTWTAADNTTLAIIPVGYADGLPRALSGNFNVAIKGRLFPVVGRICMDQCMVDVGNSNFVKRWDEVSIFGGTTTGQHDAASIAKQIGTIPYEILCNINKRVPRVIDAL
ncbi:MAG: alanine racemase [Termitinemataceae bacterium]|nr:MAG: alanine racemase [Termitinemataceae bacterium]